MKKHLLYCTLILSACSAGDSNVSQEQELSVEEKHRQFRPNFLSNRTMDDFLEQRLAPCLTEQDVAERSSEIIHEVFSDPKIDSTRVDTIQIDSQPVRIVETIYHWYPGDPGVQNSAITWTLFSSDCRVMDGGWEQLT